MDPEQIERERWHAELRRRDAEDIASGRRTAEEVNRDNAWIPNPKDWVILKSLSSNARSTQTPVNESPPPRIYQLADYKSALAAAESLNNRAILVGGQAVYFWAALYVDRFPDLKEFEPYTSKDADYLADVPTAMELARSLNSSFCPARTKGGMRGLCLGDISLANDMKVEILGHINGIKNDTEVREAALAIAWQDLLVNVMHPAQLYAAKGCNVSQLDQTNRQDGKHFGIMQWVMRGFLADLAQEAVPGDARPFLDCCEYLMRFALGDVGTKLIDLGHMPATGLWPDLTDHPSPKMQRFSRERVPRWEQQVASALEKRRASVRMAKPAHSA